MKTFLKLGILHKIPDLKIFMKKKLQDVANSLFSFPVSSNYVGLMKDGPVNSGHIPSSSPVSTHRSCPQSKSEGKESILTVATLVFLVEKNKENFFHNYI